MAEKALEGLEARNQNMDGAILVLANTGVGRYNYGNYRSKEGPYELEIRYGGKSYDPNSLVI